MPWVVKMRLIFFLSLGHVEIWSLLDCCLLKYRTSLNWEGLSSLKKHLVKYVYHDFRRRDSWGICKVYFEGKKNHYCVRDPHSVFIKLHPYGKLSNHGGVSKWSILEGWLPVSRNTIWLSAMDFAEAKGTNFVTQLMVFDKSAASSLLIL